VLEIDFLVKYTPYVERLGFDENFVDVTEMVDMRIKGGTALLEVVGHIFGEDSKFKMSTLYCKSA
jgi:DNA polymerase iota